MSTAPECRRSAPGRYRALGDQFALIAAQPADQPVEERVVGGAGDLRDVEPVLTAGKRGDLPISQLSGKQHHATAGGDRLVEVLQAACLDPAAVFEHSYFA